MRTRGLVITEDQLFEFYDKRVGSEVTSARHFDTWWKKTRRTDPDLLDLKPEDVTATEAAPTDYPGAWQQGDTRLELRYRFEPGAPDDGVTVIIPRALLPPHVRSAGFDWSVPGMRSELATALVKSLPKQLRKSMSPPHSGSPIWHWAGSPPRAANHSRSGSPVNCPRSPG